jgi:hypothetical protein
LQKYDSVVPAEKVERPKPGNISAGFPTGRLRDARGLDVEPSPPGNSTSVYQAGWPKASNKQANLPFPDPEGKGNFSFFDGRGSRRET